MIIEQHLIDEPYSPPECVVLATEYTAGDYEGSGWALAMDADGIVQEYNLGHCSCYGPFDEVFASWNNFAEFIADRDSCRSIQASDRLVKVFVKLVIEHCGNSY